MANPNPSAAERISAQLYRVTTPGTATVGENPPTYFALGRLVDALQYDPDDLAADGVANEQLFTYPEP